MKRKIVTAVIAFILCAAVVPSAGIYSVMAENEDTIQVEDGADYAALSGVWKNEDAQTDETLTLSADGLFVYHTEKAMMFRDIWNMWMNTTTEMADMTCTIAWACGWRDFIWTPRILFIWEMTELRFLPEQRKIRQKRIRKVRLKTKTAWKRKAMSSCQINAIQDCALFITIPVGKEGISIPI